MRPTQPSPSTAPPANIVLLLENPAETFDHDLLFADKFVDEQATRGIAGFDHDNDTVLRIDHAGGRSKVAPQPKHRGLSPPHANHLTLLMHGGHHAGAGPEGLADGKRGDDVPVAPYSDQQTIDDGECQR